MKRYFCCILLHFVAFNFVNCFAVQFFGKTEKIELRERIYVQTDKQLYLAGEPILMKVLTTDNKQIPIVFSKIAYVEMIGNSIAHAQIIIELINGTGTGRIQLPADLPTGYYRLIAYTQFMRNEVADVFFEKNIAVLNTFLIDYQLTEAGPETEQHFSHTEESDFSKVSLQPNKATYTIRDHGELTITGLPENLHTLSASISGKEVIPVSDSDVSLFRKNLTKKSAEFTGEYLPEYEGHIITGKLVDNQTEKSGIGILAFGLSIPGEGIRFFAGQNTQTGDVRFFTSRISGTKEIATILYHADEKYNIDIQSPFVIRHTHPEPMPALRIDTACYRPLLARSVALQVFHYFSDGSFENQNIPEPYFKMKPTWSYLLDEYTRFTTMRDVFIEFVIGARFRKRENKQEISVITRRGYFYDYGTMPLVLLDGVPIYDHDVIYNYDPLMVERINVYYGPFVMGGFLFDGIVEMTTYRRLHQDLNLGRSSQILTYEGPQLPYRLNAPDYSQEKNHRSRMPDSRHTLLWNPDVQTNRKTSISLPFDTSDLTGDFQATVEGITKDGQIVFATVDFKVEH